MQFIKGIDTFNFWQKWLFYSSVSFALFGITFAIYGDNPLFAPYNRAVASVFWQISNTPQEAQSYRGFIYGPLGGTIACCYIFLAYIAWYPFKKKEAWAQCHYCSFWNLDYFGLRNMLVLWCIFSNIFD